MKRIFTLFLFGTSFLLEAQLTLPLAPGSYSINRQNQMEVMGSRSIIWAEDFANGIPASWINNETGGIAHWEYRGISTDPNLEIGSRGTCFPVGETGEPIFSPTQTNGFVIFDSNWWDNPDNPCTTENIGTGPAPGPHLATLTTPSIDLSGHFGVALVFNQYMKSYTAGTRVELSVGGGLWQTVFTNPASPNPTMANAVQFVQISSLAGGQSDVRIRFVFEGLYYFWQLDDISIIDTYANDLEIRNSTYGNFDITDLSHPTGYEFLEYSKYPDEMAPMLKFSTQCENLGYAQQNDCKLNVKVLDINNAVLHSSQSTEGLPIPSGTSLELRAGNFQMPSTLGNYRVTFETSQTESEEFDFNNRDTAFFNINDVQYARDHYYTSAIYLGSPEYGSTQYEIGNVYLVNADNMSCHSINVGVGIGSSTPATIYGALYTFDISESLNATLVATTAPVDITPAMFNSFGDQILTTLTFDTPVPVQNGTAYFVAVGSAQGPDFFVCAMSGDAEEYTAFAKFFPADWFILDRIPMVRMNFGFYNGVETNIQSASTIAVFPNPTKEQLHIPMTDWMNCKMEMTVTDQMGKLVYSYSTKNNQEKQMSINTASFAKGMYVLTLKSDSRMLHTKFVVE
jgi:hypothetical protein